MLYIIIGIVALLGSLAFATDFSHVVRETFITRRLEYLQLNELVRTTGSEGVHRRSLNLIWKKLVFNFKQTLNGHIQSREGGSYEITCVVKGRLYKMLVIPHRGPLNVSQILDENEADITDEFLPYLLAHKTHKITPHMFGKEKVTLVMIDGERETFSEKDEILLSS